MSTETTATTATTAASQEENFVNFAAMLATPEQELADMNPDRDVFVQPRISEGWYQGVVQYKETDASKRWVKKTGTDSEGNATWWYATKVLAKITKGEKGETIEFEGRTVSPEYGGSATTKLRKNGASTVSSICLNAGKPVTKKTNVGQAEALEQVIAQSLPVKFMVLHVLKFQLKDGDEYVTLAEIKGTRSSDWPKDEQGNPDYQPTTYAVHDPEVGYRLAKDTDPQDKFVEVKGMVQAVVDRFAPIVNK